MKLMITTRYDASGTSDGVALNVTIVEYSNQNEAKVAADIINGLRPDLFDRTKDSNMRLYQSAIVLP